MKVCRKRLHTYSSDHRACLSCAREACLKWKLKNPNYKRPVRQPNRTREENLMIRYNMSLADYTNLFNIQKECCAVCERHQSSLPRVLVVDHDHSSGKVRGLLCDPCNRALGLLHDNANRIDRLKEYLVKER